MRTFLLALTAATALSTSAMALEIPAPGRDDPNMCFATYKPSQRYAVVGRLKHETTLIFGKTENVVQVSIGDPDAWAGQAKEEGVSLGNSVTLWPDTTAGTNTVIKTSLPDGGGVRIYHFEMAAYDATAKSKGDECYGVTFLYPADDRAAAAAKAKEVRAAAAEDRAVDRLKVDTFYGPRNWRYIARGDRRIAPTEASDNHQMTGLRYPGTLAIPAMFYLGPDGGERSVMPDALDDVEVLKVRARVFRMRQGGAVLDLYNCDGLSDAACFAGASDPVAFSAIPFPDVGPDPRTGTTSPHVLRRIVHTADR